METCKTKYKTTKERRSHCIEVHQFPSNFRYDVEKKDHADADSKKDKSSPPKGKPKSVGFGHGATRGFAKGRGRGGRRQQISKQTSDEKDVSMAELEEALPTV